MGKKVIRIRSEADAAAATSAKRLFCRFKMDGCAHCVNSQGEWDELCKQVETMLSPDCAVAEVERSMVPVLDLGGYAPEGYPTHSFFENGQFVKDAEDRSLQGLLNVLKEMNYIRVPLQMPAKRRQTPAKRRQTPAKRRQTLAKRRQTLAIRRQAPASKRQTPAKRRTPIKKRTPAKKQQTRNVQKKR